MAFSFRIGTKWCHDFPKLAKESGFYFHMHKSRIRVDWSRISNLDIDRIIRERDFYIIDDNVNNVIDYCLESEYDIKILDPSFVKLFRLAQLAVEYLLYCKQYLDRSVVILKDELKLKIEENVKLKKEIGTLEEAIKHLKEKAKEKNKWIETKLGDSNGEIYKCPHCPKTFISPIYLSAHVIRRHSYVSDLGVSSSPMHEHYCTETEKLHNEIKNLKERLNETERIIRNESEKGSEKKSVDQCKKLFENEVERFKNDTNKSEEDQVSKGYLEEINNLKTLLFDELHNLRQRERNMYERTSETNVQTLITQQEKEFQKLRNQLLDKLTPDIESVHEKLYAQENYWKSKIEQLEKQHQKDVEKLATELKLTQKAADDTKAEYESKVNNLERQTATQSNMLLEQSKHLHSLSHEINASQLIEKHKDSKNNSLKEHDQSVTNELNKNELKSKDRVPRKTEEIIVENLDNALSPSSSNRELPLILQDKSSRNVQTSAFTNEAITRDDNRKLKQKDLKIVRTIKRENKKNEEEERKSYSSSDVSDSEDSIPEKGFNRQKKQTKYDLNSPETIVTYLNNPEKDVLKNTVDGSMSQVFLSNTKNNKMSQDLDDDLTADTNSESIVSNLYTDSETESITTVQNDSPMHEHKTHSSSSPKSKKTSSYYRRLQMNLQNAFEQKLRDLGIDPEWQGIPKATFKQKMDILKHHQKIATKKSPKYHQIKLKIIEEMLEKLSKKGRVLENSKHLTKSPLHKASNNGKTQVVEAYSNQNNSGDYVVTSQSQGAMQKILYSPSKANSFKSMNGNESTVARTIKSGNHKSLEELIKMSPNSIKSLRKTDDDSNSHDNFMKNDSFNQMKSLFTSGDYNLTSNNRNPIQIKSVKNDSSNVDNSKELHYNSVSPKLNKSSLKSITGSANSLTKKKVIFDLKQETLNDKDSNTPSLSDERKYSPESENYKSTSNIILKTTQSDKIAELSKKLEAQLSMVRQKPIGSVETIFTSKYMQLKENDDNDNQQASSTSPSSPLENLFRISSLNSKVVKNAVPQPAPRNVKDKVPEILQAESISEISDLDSDIDKILKIK